MNAQPTITRPIKLQRVSTRSSFIADSNGEYVFNYSRFSVKSDDRSEAGFISSIIADPKGWEDTGHPEHDLLCRIQYKLRDAQELFIINAEFDKFIQILYREPNNGNMRKLRRHIKDLFLAAPWSAISRPRYNPNHIRKRTLIQWLTHRITLNNMYINEVANEVTHLYNESSLMTWRGEITLRISPEPDDKHIKYMVNSNDYINMFPNYRMP